MWGFINIWAGNTKCFFEETGFRVPIYHFSSWNRLILDDLWKGLLRCCDCVGEAGSLSANPSESHLCFSLNHLWPFSSSLVPNPLLVRSWGGEMGERGVWERGNVFLWMFPVAVSVRKRFQASRSRGAFSANTGGQAHYLFLTDH